MMSSLTWILCIIPIFLLASSIKTVSSATSIQWNACTDTRLQQLNAQCAFISVPLDHRRPRGTKIRLALSRLRHTPSMGSYQGVVLVNPGGPGGSGLRLIRIGNDVPNNVGATYDWIGFDPRGVGSSEPAVSCIEDYFNGPRPDYNPLTQSLENLWINRTRLYAQSCAKNYSQLLKYMTSIDTIKDMDLIRIALGVDKINYYAYSYGTYLGQLYATIYPNRVRRMVLDSNVNPSTSWFKGNLNQNIAFEKNIQIWFNWIARYDSVYHLGKKSCEVRDRWFQAMKELETNPAGGVIGPADWSDIFLSASYVQDTWIDLANAFSDWTNRKDSNGLIDQSSSDGDNGYAVYLAVQCTDAPWPKDWNSVRTTYWRGYSSASFMTWNNGWFNQPCQYWSAKQRSPLNINGSRVGDILLISETLDAATPYEGSLEVRRRFPGARLVSVINGTNHAYSLSGNACVDNVVAEYLRSGNLPTRKSGDKADKECKRLALPNPLASTKSEAREIRFDLIPRYRGPR